MTLENLNQYSHLFQGLDEEILWASVSNNNLKSFAALLKQCPFKITGKVRDFAAFSLYCMLNVLKNSVIFF